MRIRYQNIFFAATSALLGSVVSWAAMAQVTHGATGPALPTQATSATSANPATPAADSLYLALGGKAGVAAIAAEFVTIMLDDQRVNATFEGVDLDKLRVRLAEHICEVSDGGCKYTGRSMAESHEDLKIKNAQFNASVENLQTAMDRRAVPSRVQNRLLARLAPMQRDIVTR